MLLRLWLVQKAEEAIGTAKDALLISEMYARFTVNCLALWVMEWIM
jgi:hypothetical protein